MNRLPIALLDDSAVCRAELRAIFEADGDVVVVGEASSGDGVTELIRRTGARLLVVDLEMPGTGGQETISRVMASAPLPILVVTGRNLGADREQAFEAVRRGALDLAEKPRAGDRAAQKQLRETVRRLATVPVVRHVAGNRRPAHATVSPSSSRSPASADFAPRVVGIGASAGGPLPLTTLLGRLPDDLAAAVVVVQHLPASFLRAFADFVREGTRLRVALVSERVRLEEGTIHLPSDDRHLVLTGPGHVAPSSAPPRDGHRPSVDVLFESMAEHAARRSAGLILSGIGHDGASGLLLLRRRGGLCLAQDEATSAVFGMPRAALERGAAEAALAPEHLADRVVAWSQSARR